MSSLPEHALRTHDMLTRKQERALPPIRVQRKCGCGGTCGSCGSDKKRKVQRRALGDASTDVPAEVESVLRGPGRPLDAGTRDSMESRFGRSFADVRVHTDTHAASSARTIDAAAYTAGSHIVFGSGRFDPSSEKGRRLLAHELAHVVQQKSGTAVAEGVGPADDVHEREADRVADAVVAQGPIFTPPVVAPAPERVIRREREDESDARQPRWTPLIVEDNQTAAAGQMRRSQFVEELDAAICATSNASMARLGRSTEGCPLLDRWRPRIRQMNARELETGIRRWGDEMQHVRTARDYIPAVQRRLAESIALWGATGRLLGVPPDLMSLLGGGGTVSISVGSLIRGAVGRLFRKSRDGAPAPTDAAPALAPDGGTPLDAATATRMGSAFGRDFSGVRIHTGGEAAGEASRVAARAFTIGEHIAFADGEYQPGTLVGDALLAHELAHVAQQDGAKEIAAKSEGDGGALEQDADDAAVHAVASLWPSVRRYARGLRQNAMPRLKSSLRLQRCTTVNDITVHREDTSRIAQAADVSQNGCSYDERTTEIAGSGGLARQCCTPTMIGEIRDLYPEALSRVRNAIAALQPNERGKFDTQLQDHFGVAPNDRRVDTILSNFQGILSLMQDASTGGRVQFFCRSRQTDAFCRRPYAATSCSNGVAMIQLCGDYESSLPAGQLAGDDQSRQPASTPMGPEPRGTNSSYLYTRPERSSRTDQSFNGWVRTLIHEHAHALCTDILPSVGDDREVYRADPNAVWPPQDANRAIRNPDSYAWFAIDAGRVTRTAGSPPPDALPPLTARQAAQQQMVGTVASGCPPVLGALEARIDGRPHLLQLGDRCGFQLARAEGGNTAEGTQIYGTVGVESGCTGSLFWVQFVRRRQMATACGTARPEGLCSPPNEGWGVDDHYPYDNASRFDDLSQAAGTQRIWLGDLPGSQNISGGNFSRVCMHHQFVSYLVYRDLQQQVTPLAWVSWRMVGTAIRDNNQCPARDGGGCAGWVITPNSFAQRTGMSRTRGAMNPDVPLNLQLPGIMAGVGMTPCPPDSCPPNGVLQP